MTYSCHKGAPWDDDTPDWRHPSVFPPPDTCRTLAPGDEADIPSDYCRSTLEAVEVTAASVVWTTEGAPLVLRSPVKPLLHPEKAAMGMGDKDLVTSQQKSTQTP